MGLPEHQISEQQAAAPQATGFDPGQVSARLQDLLAHMRAVKHSPWEGSVLALYRDIVEPLCEELRDQTEVLRWQAELEAEAARLDAAG